MLNIPQTNTMLTVTERVRGLNYKNHLLLKRKSNGENYGGHAKTQPLEEPARHWKTDGLLRSNLATRAKEQCTTS